TAPRKTASLFKQASSVLSGSGVPCLRIAAPPTRCSSQTNSQSEKWLRERKIPTASRATSGPTPSPGRTANLKRMDSAPVFLFGISQFRKLFLAAMSSVSFTLRNWDHRKQILIVDFLLVLPQLHESSIDRIQFRTGGQVAK